MSHCFDRLTDACRATKSAVCVGLDPHLEMLPPDARGLGRVKHAREFLLGVLDAVAGVVPCVKPQIAFFEELGPDGYALYFEIVQEAHRRGLFVIGDVKRGDIGSTSAAYARAHLGPEDGTAADAVTVNPYLGSDGVEPFLKVGRAKGRGVFVLVRTSNASSKDFQEVGRGDGPSGEPLFLRVGRKLEEWGSAQIGERGFTDCGAVVGATHPDEGAQLRAALGKTFFLVPGYGTQGGTAADVARTFDTKGGGAVVNSSRAILFAWKDAPDGAKRYAELARAAALATTKAIADALAARKR
jgi:orotidine-5'-phosphate decarboxylase